MKKAQFLKKGEETKKRKKIRRGKGEGTRRSERFKQRERAENKVHENGFDGEATNIYCHGRGGRG